jgi:hypothetical protein
MWIREKLWVAPLYGLECLQQRSSLHRAILLCIDFFVLLLATAIFYAFGLLVGWAMFYHRVLETTTDFVIAFLAMPLGGGLIGLGLVMLLVLMCVAIFHCCKACYSTIADDSYLQPSTAEYVTV